MGASKIKKQVKLFSFNTTYKSIGIDISSSSMKIFQFEGKGQRVKGYSETPMSKGLVINDAITDAKTFNYLLKQAFEQPKFGKFDTRYAVVNLPESKSFVRVIQIPKMSDSEAANAVPFEAESFIPLPIDQVYLDWQKLGETPDKMNILIIASPKEFVDKYLGFLDGAGIKATAFEVESQSGHRAIIPKNSQETVLIVDLAASRTSLIMIEDGNLQFTSTVPIAGSAFTESIARTLGISSTKAEEIKMKVGIANTVDYPNIKTAILPVLNNLSAEIKNILKFHKEHSERQVSKILLVGGNGRLKNLPEFLALQLTDIPGLKVEIANPWVNLPNIKKVPMDSMESLGYVTAIGLAMRGDNIL